MTISKRILCYGDSNTWGYIPGTGERYPVYERWTGILQELLGRDFLVIEEGLNSRTTAIDDPEKPGKNGLTTLEPCLLKNNPLDLVFLWLGTNDMKKRLNSTAEQIRDGMKQVVDLTVHLARTSVGEMPSILLISPPLIDESVGDAGTKYLGGEDKSRQLGMLYQRLAEEKGLDFIDMAQVVQPSPVDGYHLEKEAHQKIARLLYDKIVSFFAS